MSYNVRGLNDDTKRKEVFYWIKKKNAQIIMLQETHSSQNTEHLWFKDWDGDIIFSHFSTQARGTAILFSKNLAKTIYTKIIDEEGRYIILDIDLNGLRLTLCSLYAPNVDNEDFFLNVINHIESLPNDHRIMSGDYNLVLDLKMDKKGGLPSTNSKSQAIINTYMEQTEMIDIWRFQHPDESTFTWSRRNPTKILCRLDFFLTSYGLTEKIESSTIKPGFRSDHSPVFITLVPFSSQRGKGFWKLNCSLLSDLDYIKKIKEVIKETAELNINANPNTLWDVIKMCVKGESIKYGSFKKKELNKNISEIQEQIDLLLKKYYDDPDDESNIENLDLKKEELNNIIAIKTHGAFIRSRVKEIDQSERNTRYFFNLEKRNANIKSINRLELPNGEITEDQTVILKEMENFYTNLYKSSVVDNPATFMDDIQNKNEITLEQKVHLEKDITEEEIKKVIKKLPRNKTPGEDGLPSEFYQIFWIDIKKYLVQSFKYSFDNEELSITQRRGILSLIPKKTNPLKLKNWRPISLLNQDYKILAKLLAERIKICLPHLIDEDQSGFIKGRYIGQNITNIIDLIHYTEENDIPALIMSIDYEKAFDKLEWSFIKTALEYFKFPPAIIKWVNILYTNISSCVTNNGWNSRYFPLYRGVRQGCPLSPYLFILAVEILAISIRENKRIKGVVIGEKEFKIKLYADDTQLVTLFDSESVTELGSTFEKFSKISGLTVNYEKSNILRIGSIRNSSTKIKTNQPFTWTNDPLEILGITITVNLEELASMNFTPVINKINNIIRMWSKRKFTLFGKIIVINALLASQLVYKMSVLPSPGEKEIKEIDKILYNYLWDNKPHKIAKTVMLNEVDEGGLHMVDTATKNTSLKIAWIKRLAQSDKFTISPLIDKYCKIDTQLLLKCNIHENDISSCFRKNIPPFWLEVLKSWCQFNHRRSADVANPRNEIIWFNSNIKISNKVVILQELVSVDIIYVKDLLDENNTFYTLEELQVKYNISINFLSYYGLLHAIPKEFKEKLHSSRTAQINISRLLATEKVPKFVYKELIKNKTHFPEKSYQWHQETLNINMSREHFISIFVSNYRGILNNKFKDFQFRLLHNAIITNIQLKKWNLLNDDSCTFCQTQPESVLHLLIDCHYSNKIWVSLFDYIAEVSGVLIRPNKEEKILGIHDNDLSSFYNNVMIICKQYIYASRCLKKKPCIKVLIKKIKFERKLEYLSAIQNDKLNLWNDKWKLFESVAVE